MVFTEKFDADGEIIKRKVRIVAKGYTEVWGEDFWNMYSPTLGRDTLFSSLAYMAYLNSNLVEVIYL